MKITKSLLTIALLLIFIFPLLSYAHTENHASFFTINDEDSLMYPVSSNTSFPDFTLPKDIATKPYLIHTPIEFKINTKELQEIITEDIGKTTFSWDFGDGTKGEGLQNTHTYTKMGSYILSITASYRDDSGQQTTPQLIQSILFHIIPNTDYQLPKAIIMVNGKTMEKDPANNFIEINFSQNISFDASKSTASSSKIVSYFWDFDDGTSGKEKTLFHLYPTTEKRQYASPALRIKDANGFISDSYVQLKHNPGIANFAPSLQQLENYWIILGGIGAIGILLFILKQLL